MTGPHHAGSEVLISDVLFFGDMVGHLCEDPSIHTTSAQDYERVGDVTQDEDMTRSTRLRSHFTTYAHPIFTNSHRSHIIAFVALLGMARLLRFDASGVIFSELFPWKTTSHLAQAFQRMAAASPTERGLEPSATQLPNDLHVITEAKAIFDKAIASDQPPSGVMWEAIFKPEKALREAYWLFEGHDEVT